jgi:serine/threonine protein kinase
LQDERRSMKWLSDAALDRLRAAADSPDLSGTRYELVEKLGEGGMGGVYRVADTELGRQVALKAIRVVDSSGEFAARLLREAKIIAQLEHPGIVPVHDVGTLPDGRVFYTMKLVQGRRLDQYSLEAGGIPERLRTFQKICEAVSFAHAHNVLHRDLKPQNIMVGTFGEVLVMDWGLARVLSGEAPVIMNAEKQTAGFQPKAKPVASSDVPDTAHGAVLGTPGYMAPEQARGDRAAIGLRTDVYALGVVLDFLLRSGGRRPKALAAISRKATAEDIELRYSSVEDLRNDISHYLDGMPVSAYPEGAFTRAWRWASRNRAWILLILAYLVMRAVFILWRAR